MDCVVVGAGPAGLAASAALAERGLEHVVLERSRAGESWRSQRWDSFRLNTPGWMNEVLGAQAPDARASDAEFRARAVVVATGDQNVPVVPPIARSFPTRIAQLHAAEYRNAGALPDGTVLVVGSAQSGCQIAEDVAATGRRVVLATSAAAVFPMPYRGRDTLAWLVEAGFYEQRPADLPDPAAMRAPQPIMAPAGRALSLRSLARAGVMLTGRPLAVAGERVTFDASVPGNVATGDAFARRVRTMVDELISRSGLDAKRADPDEDGPVAAAPSELDLRDVGAVVWCTGFTGDFSWLGSELLDDGGLPRRDGAAAAAPGVWFVGLKWLTRRRSGILHGFPTDAASVADAVHGLVAPASPG
jgi:putative flavoprotein involved in K+ transport